MSEPLHLQSPSGLCVQVNANGSIRRIDHRDILLNLFLGTEIEGGPANLYLRRLGTSIEAIPLLGPRSPAVVRLDAHGLRLVGEWSDLRFQVSLVLATSAPAWVWHVRLENTGSRAVRGDRITALDLALSQYAAVRMNEYYVSQYVDYTPLIHADCGAVLAVRQNLAMDGRHPWAVIGSLGHAVTLATHALQLHGLATRAGKIPPGLQAPALPGKRRQHEHSMAVIQDAALRLAPGETATRGFFAWFEADHAAASSPADLMFVDKALALPEASPPSDGGGGTGAGNDAATLFSARPLLASLDLSDAEVTDLFGSERRHVERDGVHLLSFFTAADRHVVLKAKELRVLRPHGHILRSGDRLVPDEASLTTTTWMAGVFNSLTTQGHVGINRLLSTTRSYLGLLRAGGQRIFVELKDGYRLLDVPSAYEMSPNGCRWIYKHRGGVIEVRVWAPSDRHELNLSVAVHRGSPRRFLLSHHVAINGDDGADAVPVLFAQDENGVVIRPIPECDVGRRFPQGFFRIDADRGTTIERVGGDELLFADGQSRQQPFLTIVTAKTAAASLRLTGHLVSSDDTAEPARAGQGGGATPPGAADFGLPTSGGMEIPQPEARGLKPSSNSEGGADESQAEQFWTRMIGPLKLHPAGSGEAAEDVRRLQEILPWFVHNALIHYLAPRGLEQYSGGGWGTRDVSQGPVEMLLALGRAEPVRDLLLRLFKAQNPDGDWPQWFMFFERDRLLRAPDAHGDIVFWPPLALAQYLLATDDASILDSIVPFFHEDGDDHAEHASIWSHVERALAVISARVIPGTHLPAYGHGDWNDSLQPVDPSMRERLCSSWTATLYFQTITTLAKAWRRVGRVDDALRLEAIAPCIAADLQRLLIVDDTLAGFAYFHPDERIDYLLHPRDGDTGMHYRLLPMIHAIINDLLSPEQAATHVGYIKQHLLGPDGARLFDRPPPYQGGPQRYFQRAESTSFFGRENGLMYMHAHLRYAEAMAHYGDADAFFLALRQANPIGIRTVVAAAQPRQANCYYTSSDAAFADRYEAQSRYDEVKTGAVPLDGGWRVYSSGAGLALRLIHECFLGIRKAKSVLSVDPVLPKRLDGLGAEIEVAGKPVYVAYHIAAVGHGPTSLILNGKALPFERAANPYRCGAAQVAMAAVTALLNDQSNTLHVQLQ